MKNLLIATAGMAIAIMGATPAYADEASIASFDLAELSADESADETAGEAAVDSDEADTKEQEWNVSGLITVEAVSQRTLQDLGVTLGKGKPAIQTMALISVSNGDITIDADIWHSEAFTGDQQVRGEVHETDFEFEVTANGALGACSPAAKAAYFQIRDLDPVYQVRGKLNCNLGDGFSASASAESVFGGFDSNMVRAGVGYNGQSGDLSYGVEAAIAVNDNDDLKGVIIPATVSVSYPVTENFSIGGKLRGFTGERTGYSFGLGFAATF